MMMSEGFLRLKQAEKAPAGAARQLVVVVVVICATRTASFAAAGLVREAAPRPDLALCCKRTVFVERANAAEKRLRVSHFVGCEKR